MPETAYTYSIASDMPAGRVNTSRLEREIEKSSIVTAIVRIDTAGDELSIVFADQLQANEKTTLDNDTSAPAGGLLAAHDYTSGIRLLMGDSLNYQFASIPNANEIQYTCVEDDVPSGFLSRVELYVIEQGPDSGTIRVGVYSSVDGEPGVKLAEGSISFAPDQDELLDDTLVKIALNQPVQPTEPFFLAVLSTVATITLLSTDTLVAAIHPVRFQQTLDGQLPAGANGQPDSATAFYAALVE